MRYFKTCAVAGSALALVLANQAFAQSGSGGDTAAQATRGASGANAPIIVTARKRDESILKVPVVLTAITQDDLERFSTDDIYTVAHRVPGLLVGTSLAANGLQVSMRGIGTTANNATIDNSISLNVDGLQLSQGLAYNLGMFDLGQIEVLKGPQALFYGKNSPAGVISLRSADPTDSLYAMGRVGYEFEADELVGEAVLAGPLSDSLKARVALRYADKDGYFRNVVDAATNLGSINPTDRRVNATKDLMLRGTLMFESGGFSSRFKASYQNMKQDGSWPSYQTIYCPEGLGGDLAPLFTLYVGDGCKLDRKVAAAWPDPAAFAPLRNNGKPFNDLEQALFSLENKVPLGDGLELTSLTGFYKMKQEYLFLAGFGRFIPLVADNDFLAEQFTQELRLTSDLDGPLNFMAGAYYQDAFMKTRVNLLGNTATFFPAVAQDNDHKIDIEAFSLFGQLLWNITPELEFAPGVRWTDEKRIHTQFNFAESNGPVGQSVLFDPKVSSSNFSPEATLTYTPSDDLTLFAAFKTGFKSGSFNATIFSAPTTESSFGDEKVKGGEIGLKSRLADGQVNFNAAAYYYRYTGLQVGAGEIKGQVIINRTLNAASANVYGLDLDMSYAPYSMPGLSVQAAVNYNHARYGSFPNAPCGNGQTIGEGCDQLPNPTTGNFSAQDLKGEPLVRAPNWMGTLSVDYDMPVGDSMNLHLGSLLSYSSKYSLNLTNLPGFYQPAYAKVNATIALSDSDERWEVALIGNNLTDKLTSANCFNSNSQNGIFFGGQVQGAALPGPAGTDEANCVTERGREVWLRLTVKYGN